MSDFIGNSKLIVIIIAIKNNTNLHHSLALQIKAKGNCPLLPMDFQDVEGR
jgi:hypothetical protein